MFLKEDIDLNAFLDRASQCEGDIYFHTNEGDFINLKSTLSRYIFASMAKQENVALNGEVICQNSQDEILMDDYLQAE